MVSIPLGIWLTVVFFAGMGIMFAVSAIFNLIR